MAFVVPGKLCGPFCFHFGTTDSPPFPFPFPPYLTLWLSEALELRVHLSLSPPNLMLSGGCISMRFDVVVQPLMLSYDVRVVSHKHYKTIVLLIPRTLVFSWRKFTCEFWSHRFIDTICWRWILWHGLLSLRLSAIYFVTLWLSKVLELRVHTSLPWPHVFWRMNIHVVQHGCPTT